MKEIYLRGKDKDTAILVDDEDYEYLNQFKWYLFKNKTNKIGYAKRFIRKNRKTKVIAMHRELLNITDSGIQVDHRNENSLDNQKINLRSCSSSENMANRGINRRNTSGFKGVSLNKQSGKWEAYITKNRKQYSLGLFKCKYEAAEAYKKAAVEMHGDFANVK